MRLTSCAKSIGSGCGFVARSKLPAIIATEIQLRYLKLGSCTKIILGLGRSKILNPTQSDFKYPSLSDFRFLKKCWIPSDSDSESVTYQVLRMLPQTPWSSCYGTPPLHSRPHVSFLFWKVGMPASATSSLIRSVTGGLTISVCNSYLGQPVFCIALHRSNEYKWNPSSERAHHGIPLFHVYSLTV